MLRPNVASLLVCSLLLALATTAHSAADPRKAEPKGAEATLSSPGEPGDPFEMYGVVFASSGEPIRNTKMFFYHADSKGRYTLTHDGPLHLAAVLRTDELGRYRIHTAFPGNYGYPAHVHYEILEAPGGGGFVNVRQDGREAPRPEQSVTVKKAKDGVWRLHWDLRPHVSGPAGSGQGTPRGSWMSVPELRYPPKSPPDTTR